MRLHRKIVVIDGAIAWTGSMNLVDPRFFKQDAGVGEWVDAMVRLQGSVVVPDFISAAGAVLGAVGVSADELGASTIAALDPLEDSPELFVAACVAAEEFMQTWTGDLPFGRPLAP